MNQEAVRNKMEVFLGFLREEQELQDQLLTLDFSVMSAEKLDKTLKRQSKIIASIQVIRNEKMLPILRELTEFIASKAGKTPAAQ